MEPVTRRARAGAVALPERPDGGKAISRAGIGPSERVRTRDHADRPGPVVEDNPEPVGHRGRRLDHRPGESDAPALQGLRGPAGGSRDGLGEPVVAQHRHGGSGHAHDPERIPLVESPAQPHDRAGWDWQSELRVEVDGDACRPVLDEPGAPALEHPETGREDAFGDHESAVGHRPCDVDRQHRDLRRGG